ncbi:hypothetical protein HMPREF9370_0752 [Neisseria wadsworthii 9715]|uniref:Uncharacterized protein n=1 Tax=Neisseria wadsworthii 9715 TaxID=1030841 RepID=G4CNU3_9NEIS|nr:hypothetical protein HMPREF9370_0752 [Neisseria wadsworthii 9715]
MTGVLIFKFIRDTLPTIQNACLKSFQTGIVYAGISGGSGARL